MYYFWGGGVFICFGEGVGFMPLFRCIYFFYIFFLKSLALCLFIDVFIYFYTVFFLKSLSFFIYFFSFWGWGGGWA